VHAIAGIDAFAAIDAAIEHVGAAWVEVDEALGDTVIAARAIGRATFIVGNMQRLARLERMLPDPVDANETAPEVAQHRYVEQNDQHEYGVNPIQGSGERRTRPQRD